MRAQAALLLAILAASFWSCQAPAPAEHGTGAAPLGIAISAEGLDRAPDLVAELRRSPYSYFRFINREFAQRVCELVEASPSVSVNVHGDAHLEQYTVTSESRGLMDFDDSAFGPAVLDLARFGVSVKLAARARGWSAEEERLLVDFLAGYKAALLDPHHEAPVPRVVERVRSAFVADRAGFLESAEKRMSPRSRRPDELDPTYRTGLRLFAEAMLEQHPEMPPDFFDVKKAGELRMGIGSGLDRKYLFRVEGPTHADRDDLVFEAKLLRNLESVSCMRRGREDPVPILIAQSRIAYRPYEYVGYVHLREMGESPRGADVFWVHSWIENYAELSTESFATVEELREVVYDVGVQLGRGHPRTLGQGGEHRLRESLLYMTDARQRDYLELVDLLTEEVLTAWRRFVESRP